MIDLHRILLLFAFWTLAAATISGPMGYCLGNCANCDPYNLAQCKGLKACQWGFYDPSSKGNCSISPSLTINSQQLGERNAQGIVPSFSGWGIDAKLTKCEYLSLGWKQIIDVIGFFQSSQSIEKQYEVPQQTQLIYLSFTLVRGEWVPFSDFLMIELTADGASLDIFEISYQSMIRIDSQTINVTCQGRKVFLQQYHIKINKKLTTSKVKICFSSFLFDSVWGITNVKFITGCSGFAGVNNNTLGCSICQEGTYLQRVHQDFGTCNSCPALCKNCSNGDTCTACHWGSLVNRSCQISSIYKRQSVSLESIQTCNNYAMTLSTSNSLVLPGLINKQNHLYDEVIISLTMYYDTSLPQTPNQVSITANGFSIHNLTLNATQYDDGCSLFDSGRMARVSVVTKAVHVNDNTIILGVNLKGVKKVGVSDATVYSIKKDQLNGGPEVTSDIQTEQNDEILQINQEPNAVTSQDTTTTTIQGSSSTQSSNVPIQAQNTQGESSSNFSKVAGSMNSSGVMRTPSQIRFDTQEDAFTDISTYAETSKGLLQLSIENVPIIQGQILIEIIPLTPSDYALIENYYADGSLVLVVNITKSFTDGLVTIREMTLPSRLLVVGQTQVIARVEIKRFDAYSEETLQSVSAFGVFFSILSWIAIISMLMAVLSGLGIIVEEHIITIQLLYLHVYIGYDMLPLSFREVVSNLRTVGFLHFVPESIVENEWSLTPEAMYWLSPNQFNFIHAFLPLFVSILIYTFWFFGLLALKKWFLPLEIHDDSRSTLHKLADNIVCRVINFADSIWRYQFISIMLICIMQFVASSHSDQTADLAFAIIVIIGTIVWFAITEIYIRNQYYQNEYSEFIYKFEDRYFCKIPLHSLPSRHHRLGYPLFRVTKSLLFVLIATLIPVPLLDIAFLVAINAFEMWYIIRFSIFSDRKLFKLKIAENSLLLCLQGLLFGVRLISFNVDAGIYLAWGFILSTITLMTILITIGRVIFILYLKYIQSKGVSFEQVDIDQRKLQTDRAV